VRMVRPARCARSTDALSVVLPPRAAAPLPMPPDADLARRLAGTPLLVALDIDGTLAPIAPTPDAAAVPVATRAAIARLVVLTGVHVALVTGRAAADGKRMVGLDNTWIIGNHGFERIDTHGMMAVDPRIERYGPDIGAAAAALTARLGDISGVIVENKRWTLSVHYRLVDRALLARVENEAEAVARQLSLRCIVGKQVIELRPPVDVNKGTALLDLARSLGIVGAASAAERVGAVLYVGDDRTDEDAFRLLRAARPDNVTIHVGGGTLATGEQTAAELLVPDTHAVLELLVWLAAER